MGNTIMARLFVSGHRTSTQGAGMKTKDFLCRAAEEQEPGAQPPPPAAPGARFGTTRACRAQLAPRAVRIHPCAFQCSHGKGGSEEEVGLGSHIVSTSQQTPPGHSALKTKLPLLPPLSGVRIALRSAAVGEAALPPARSLQGLCLHQCSCQVPQMQPSC